jgi:hypothetical protein
MYDYEMRAASALEFFDGGAPFAAWIKVTMVVSNREIPHTHRSSHLLAV